MDAAAEAGAHSGAPRAEEAAPGSAQTRSPEDAGGAPASPAESAEGTADELLERLLHCDEQLAELLATAGSALRALVPGEQAPSSEAFEERIHHWFATLNVCTTTAGRTDANRAGGAADTAGGGARAAAGAAAAAHDASGRARAAHGGGWHRWAGTRARRHHATEPLDAADARGGVAPRGGSAAGVRRPGVGQSTTGWC